MNFVLSKNDYIRIHLVSVLTYFTSSLQTSLQNQAKQEGNEKVTSSRSGVKLKEMIKCIVHRIKNIFSFSEKAGRLDFIFTTIGLVIFVAVGYFIYYLIYSYTQYRYVYI